MQQNDVLLVITSVPDAQHAHRVAEALIELGLAACVHIGAPGVSVYRWAGVTEHTEEYPLLIKTTQSRKSELLDRLVSLHPYDVPEVIVVPVVGGHTPYLDWVRTATSGLQA